MPITEIATGLASAKTLASLLKGAKEARDSVKFSEIVIEAQQVILSLQESLLEAQEKIDSVVKKKAELEEALVTNANWEAKASRYELVKVREGLFAYLYGAASEGDKTPEHWACPKCFADRRVQILQQPDKGRECCKCFHCEFEVNFGDASPQIQVIRRGRRRWPSGL